MTNADFAVKSVEVFEQMKNDLSELGFNVQIMPNNNDNAVPQLLIGTGNTESSPVIQVMFVDDLLEASNIKKDPATALIVQFFASMPFKSSKENIETYRLLSIFNRVCPVGYFGLSESEGAFFRYSFLSKDKNMDKAILTETVQIMSFFIRTFSGKLIDYVTDKKTYDQVVADIEKELTQVAAKQ